MNNRHLPEQDVYRPEGQACPESCLPTGPLLSGPATRRVFGGYFIILPISSRKGRNYEIRRIRDYLEENNERRILWTVCFLDRDPAWLPSASWQGSLTMCSWLKPHVCWICVPHLTSINKWLGGSGLICLPTQTTLFGCFCVPTHWGCLSDNFVRRVCIRVSQKTQKSEFWFATKPTGFHRLEEPPEKISAL